MAMREPIYKLRGVHKEYGARFRLQIDHLDIYPGETLAVVGPNGAGKTTLLRLLDFLEPCSRGELQFDGYRNGYPAPLEVRRRIGMVFQRPILLKRSVWKNVIFGLRLRGLKPGEDVKALLRQLFLEKLAGEPVVGLSAGEMQRVAIGRALAVNPEVLLLDEPSANLDPYNMGLIETIIGSIRQQANTTIVLVTHNVFQARRLADRVAMLLGGECIEVAETERFFERSSDPRVAAFIRGELVG
jgi:tungstate transport system ATP-binding protein